MGIWRTRAPISSDANWFDDVYLKYHSSGKDNKPLSQEETDKIFNAYAMAVSKLEAANTFMKSFSSKENRVNMRYNTYINYFRKDEFAKDVASVLTLTLAGMKNSMANRIYINDDSILKEKFKKSGQNIEAGGYVKSSTIDTKAKSGGKIVLESKTYKNTGDKYDEKIEIASSTRKMGHIHLNKNNLSEDVKRIAHVLIHEATHRFAGTADVAYLGEKHALWGSVVEFVITGAHAVNNADSYAAFCMKLDSA